MASNDIKVVITLKKGVTRLEFGYPLLLESMAESAVPYTECADIDAVAELYDDTTAIYKAAQLLFLQEKPPSKIAVASVTGKATAGITALESRGWRQVLPVNLEAEGNDTLAEFTTYMEARASKQKIAFITVSSLTALAALTKAGFERTVAFYYPENEDYPVPVAALIGETAGKAAGSLTYKNQVLKGLPPLELDDPELEAIHEAGAFTLVTKAGDNVTSEGKTIGGEYIDIVDSKDWIIQQIAYREQKVLNTMDKVPYDNRGIDIMESTNITVLREAFNNQMIAVDDEGLPAYSTHYLLRSETSQDDRTNRLYIGGSFSFDLAGAIHGGTVNGMIIV